MSLSEIDNMIRIYSDKIFEKKKFSRTESQINWQDVLQIGCH